MAVLVKTPVQPDVTERQSLENYHKSQHYNVQYDNGNEYSL